MHAEPGRRIYPPNHPLFSPSILEYHHFWKHPDDVLTSTSMGVFRTIFCGRHFFKMPIFRKQVFFLGEFLHLCHPTCIFNEPTHSCDEGVIHSRWCSFICVRSGARTTNQSIVTSTGRCHMRAYGWGGFAMKGATSFWI